MADRMLSPDGLNDGKLPRMNPMTSPTVAMKMMGMNLRMVVISWNEPMFFTPARFTNAGTHRPIIEMIIARAVLAVSRLKRFWT